MLGYLSPRPQKFEWPVWHCPLIYWPGNGRRPCVVFVPQMNVIHEIGDVTAQWLNYLDDIGQGQRSLRVTHPLMLVIIVLNRERIHLELYMLLSGHVKMCHIFAGGWGKLNQKECWDIKISGKSSIHIIVTTPHCAPCIMELILSCGHHICHTESYLRFDSCMYQS